jgi:hypothetical protein
MADEIVFWNESYSTVDDPISKGADFGIFQEFRGTLNALQTFSTPIVIHKNSKEIKYKYFINKSENKNFCNRLALEPLT